MLNTEISILSKVRHPNCVSLLELFETEDAVYLVTDLAEGGELFDQLLKKGSYTEGDAARLVREILLGVEYLHEMDIVHRDLKPENLLFMDKTDNARLMITDFGLSKVLTSGNDVLMTACGTPGYVAPEVLEQIGHGKPVDIWSVGVIAYTLLCGYTPFWGEGKQAIRHGIVFVVVLCTLAHLLDSDDRCFMRYHMAKELTMFLFFPFLNHFVDQASLFECIISGEYEYEEEYWKDISGLGKAFIDSLLVRPADKRPSATQALNHPWFRTMLEQDMVTPLSPADSVNLLPGVRKNFNARSAFKKAVRAVGLIRKMQTSSGSSFGSGEDLRESEQVVVTGGKNTRPSSTLSFHDIVSAAVMTKKGLNLGATEEDDEEVGKVDEVLSDLTIKDA